MNALIWDSLKLIHWCSKLIFWALILCSGLVIKKKNSPLLVAVVEDNNVNKNCNTMLHERPALWFCYFNTNTVKDEPELLLSPPMLLDRQSFFRHFQQLFNVFCRRKKENRISQTSFGFQVLYNHFLSVPYMFFL